MRKGENTVFLRGYVGKDPDFKELKHKNHVARFSIATKTSYQNSAGEWIDVTEWHQVEAWGKLAQRVAKWFRKGDYVTAKGTINYRKWEAEGGTKYMTVIKLFDCSNCDKIDLETRTDLGSIGESGAGVPASGDGQPGPAVDQDDDLPF